MSIDEKTVKHIATLSRIAVADNEISDMTQRLSDILTFVEQLNELDTRAIAPMTGAMDIAMKQRADKVTDGGYVADIVANAPQSDDDYFVVPKVVD